MKKIKYLIFLLALSSCNQYLGTIDSDYTPLKEVTEIYSNVQFENSNREINSEDIIYPNITNQSLSINNFEINKIINTDKESVVNFFNDKIYISKKTSLYVLDNTNEKIISEFKLNLIKDEHILNFFEYQDKIYFITNRSRQFVIDDQDLSEVNDYGIFINGSPILKEETLILFSVFGDIYHINLNENIIQTKANFDPKPGINLKSNIYEDQSNIYYLFNSGTLITFDKDSLKSNNNYIIEDLNIMTSLGDFSDLIDAPFNYNNYLYFLDHSGKIAVFDPITADILWQLDINDTILKYNFSKNGQLIILTLNKILIISDYGNVTYEYSHNIESPMSFLFFNEYFYVISEKGITPINFYNKSEDIFYNNKFYNNLDIYYQGQNIFLKDDKSLFKLSE